MAWQKYPVSCACGTVHEVSAGSAGSTFACECGRPVEVPSLVKLKASVGKAAVSADFELDQLVGTSALPMEETCGACGAATAGVRHVNVSCERSEERQSTTWAWSPLALLAGAVRFVGERTTRRLGRDVAYRLPVRVCDGCAARSWPRTEVRALLERTPLYARLFDKYPHAKVGDLR